MAEGHLSLAQAGKDGWSEDVSNQPRILVRRYDAVAAHCDACAFLAPVLEGIEAVVGELRDIAPVGEGECEDAALLMDAAAHLPSPKTRLIIS